MTWLFQTDNFNIFTNKVISSSFTRRSFQNVHQPWWTVYNDFYPVKTEVTSICSSLPGGCYCTPLWVQTTLNPIPFMQAYGKCIAQYRLKFQIIHCQFFFWIRPWQRSVYIFSIVDHHPFPFSAVVLVVWVHLSIVKKVKPSF